MWSRGFNSIFKRKYFKNEIDRESKGDDGSLYEEALKVKFWKYKSQRVSVRKKSQEVLKETSTTSQWSLPSLILRCGKGGQSIHDFLVGALVAVGGWNVEEGLLKLFSGSPEHMMLSRSFTGHLGPFTAGPWSAPLAHLSAPQLVEAKTLSQRNSWHFRAPFSNSVLLLLTSCPEHWLPTPLYPWIVFPL